MARIGKKGAQGNGDLRSYFGFPKVVPNVVTKAGSMIPGYISPKKDRTGELDSRSTTPPTPAPDAQTADANMRPIGDRELKALTAEQSGFLEDLGSVKGRKRTRTLVGTISLSTKSSPPSRTSRTPVALRTVRVSNEQEEDESEATPQSPNGDKGAAPARQFSKKQLSCKNDKDRAMKKATELANIGLNGSPRIATRKSYASFDPSSQSSLSKTRTSTRQKSSESPVSNTPHGPPPSRIRKVKRVESDERLSTPPAQRRHKEVQPGSRSSSRLKRYISTNRDTPAFDQDDEPEGRSNKDDAPHNKPYECSACGHRFKRNCHLKTHQRNVHEEVVKTAHTIPWKAQPFQCAGCRKGYTCSDSLLRHQRTAHGESWSTPRRHGRRQSQIQTNEDAEMAESFTPSHTTPGQATRSRKEQLAAPIKPSPQSCNAGGMSPTSRRLRSQTMQSADSAEMSVASSTSNRSRKRKRDEPAEASPTPPSRSQSRRGTRLDPYASSPSLSITKGRLSRMLQPAKVAASPSPSDASSGSLNRERKRDLPSSKKGGAIGPRYSPKNRAPSNAYSSISPTVEPQPEQSVETAGQRSFSLSSENTIEDGNRSSREDDNRTLWSAILNEKSLQNRELSNSPPPPEMSPDLGTSVLAPTLSPPEKASNVPGPIVYTSFSSLLRSSQPSKRVVSHGKEMVLGSDDDDTDGSLPDVETLFPKKRKVNSVLNVKAIEPEPKKEYAFSLDALIQEEKQAAAAEARIEAAKSRLQVNGNHQTHQNGQVVTRESAMAYLVENVDQDEGNARRVREAYRRTEALDFHEVWHFFDKELPVRAKHAFPTFKTSNKVLALILNDPARRHQALVTGFLTRLAAHTPLPREVMLWMMEEVCREPKEVLVQSYVNVLEASFDRQHQVVTPTRIDSLFKQMGACETTLSPGSTAIASQEPVGVQKRAISSRVHILVSLLERLAKYMTSKSRKRALHLLALASFDDSVVQDGYLAIRIEASIDTLLRAIPDEDFEQEILDMGELLFDTVKSPVLRHQLISALPCYTTQTHRFRRQLALAFALNSPKHLESSLDNSKLINHVLLSLQKSKHYQIGKKTDYTVTDAYFSMLDVAVDVGFSNLNFAEASPADSGTGASEDRTEGVRKNLFAARLLRKGPVNPQEKAFNEDVDRLVKEIRDIMSLILDSGASDMARTECKATAGRMVKRLENGVRTRTKPTKDWYNRNDQGKNLMESFVMKEVEKEPVDTVMNNAVPEDQHAEQPAIVEQF